METLVSRVTPLRWRDGLELLDQRRLPWHERWLEVPNARAAARLIRALAVRGAPAIGLAAAYALAVEARRDPRLASLRRAAIGLVASRPTAVNLAWAVAESMRTMAGVGENERAAAALGCARRLHADDAAACRAIASGGAALLTGRHVAVLTICNTGALATGGIGTAAGIIRALHAAGRLDRVFACETRPVLQGARLTTWELLADGIPVTLLPDGAAAALLAGGGIDAVLVGADRIAADGAVANKVGTYALAVAAARHRVPVIAAAPVSTFDLACPSGAAIPIEQRAASEVTRIGRRRLAAVGVTVFNPSFDVTPADLFAAIVCERGVIRPVNEETVREVAG